MTTPNDELPAGPKPGRYDTVGKLIAWENGELDDAEELELFQHLVANGMIWQLQGMYGRRAHRLGLI